MVLKKYNLDWENRYDIISRELRNKIIDELEEPFKKRGSELKRLIDEHPKLIDEKGNPTERLVIVSNKYIDGHIIKKVLMKRVLILFFKQKTGLKMNNGNTLFKSVKNYQF